MLIMLGFCQSVIASGDDLINCRWKNGESMSESVCESQRTLQHERDIGVVPIEGLVNTTKPKQLKARALTKQEKDTIIKAIKHELKDPSSAQFRWMQFAHDIKPNDWFIKYCGLVNSKNSYGGYVGYQPFLVILSWKDGILDKNPILHLGEDGLFEDCADEDYVDFSFAK